MSNEGYHEPVDELSHKTRDVHRAITSLMEELEAVDWYNQRVNACKGPELKAILELNRDEEKNMGFEWNTNISSSNMSFLHGKTWFY